MPRSLEAQRNGYASLGALMLAIALIGAYGARDGGDLALSPWWPVIRAHLRVLAVSASLCWVLSTTLALRYHARLRATRRP